MASSFRTSDRFPGLEVGMVLKLLVPDTIPPKEKRFIVVGNNDDTTCYATVYINTTINKKINWARELIELHVLFEAEGRVYLDWDSYVDCSKLIIRDRKFLYNAIKKRPEAIIGKLSDEDLLKIKEIIKNAPTIKGKHKKKFGFYS
jgi:hypothetical protein